MKLVFPFDSPLTILPLITIAVLLVLYAVLIVKLKPSKEYIETTEDNYIDSEKLEAPTNPPETTESATEAVMPAVQEGPTEAVETEIVDTEIAETKANALNVEMDETIRKNSKDKETKKSFFLFGERDFEGCPHKFGYLKSLRKNAPIPDECFGCPQILECLMTRKNK